MQSYSLIAYLFVVAPIVVGCGPSVRVEGRGQGDATTSGSTTASGQGGSTASGQGGAGGFAAGGTGAGGIACVAPPEGILSWWRGEGTALDTMGVNPGALTAGAGFVPGKVGQAFQFDGQSWLEATSAGLPLGNAERTLEAWIRVDQVPSWNESFFAGYGKFGSFNATYHLGSIWPTVFFSQWGGGVADGLLQQSQWHHIAVTNVGSLATLYLDGIEIATVDDPITTPPGTQFFIGRIPGPPGDIRRLVGAVDEVTIYDRALGALELHGIFAAGSTGKCPPGGN